MTKRDFETVAYILRCELDLAVANEEAHGSRAIVGVIESLSERFAAYYPRFDRVKFLDSCGVDTHSKSEKISTDILPGENFWDWRKRIFNNVN